MSEPVFLSSVSAHTWNADHTQVAVAPNSRFVYIYDAKGEDVKKWKKIHSLEDHFMTITGMDWNAKTNMLATSGQDRNAYVWTLENNEWKPTLVILRIGRAATCIKWNPDGTKFAVGSGSKQIPVCHYEKSQDLWVAQTIKKGPKSSVLTVDWSPNGLFLIAGGSDFKCRIFSGYIKKVDGEVTPDAKYTEVWGDSWSNFGTILAEFDQSRGWIESATFSPCGMKFAFSGHDSTVHFGDLSSGKVEVQTILRRDLPIRALAFLDRETAVGGGYDNVPIRYVYKDGRWEEEGPVDTGKTASSKPVAKKSAFGSAFAKFDQKSKLGKSGAGTETALPFRHQNIINDIVVYEKGKFTTSSVDGRVLHWDMAKKY